MTRFYVANYETVANIEAMIDDPRDAMDLELMATPQLIGVRPDLDPAWVDSLKAIVEQDVCEGYSDDDTDEAKAAVRRNLDWNDRDWASVTWPAGHPWSSLRGYQQFRLLFDGELVALLVIQEREYP